MPATRVALLHELADGAPRPGAALARAARCTPAAARRGVAALRELGAEIQSVPGKGYRLATPMTALDSATLHALLLHQSPAVDLVVLDEVDSTNAYLLREAAAGAPGARSGRACIAEIQTAGRGRRGRSWYAVPGASLAFSMLWRFDRQLGFLAGLSLAAGVAVARVLHAIGAHEVRLKWPNDVLYRQHKLAGILVETQGGGDAPSVAVVGVGINLRLPPAVRERIDQAVTDLAAATAVIPERNTLAAMLLTQLAAVLEEFSRKGFGALREEWAAMHAYQGRAVRVRGGGASASGRVLGVAADGALLIDTAEGERRYYSGEISLRAA